MAFRFLDARQIEQARRLQNARQLRLRARRRLCQTSTARERRAIYLLEAGKSELYATEFPGGVEP